MTFGQKLQALRRTKGLSQEQLAGQITVSRQAVSKWELDAAMPDTENILQISRLFSVTTDYLLNDEMDAEQSAAHLQESETRESAAADSPEHKALPPRQKNGVSKAGVHLQTALIILTIYMIFFALGVMINPFFLPFFAMLATAVSILTVIVRFNKTRR